MIVSLSNVLLVVIIARLETMSILDLLLQQNLETRDQLLQLLSQTSSQGDTTLHDGFISIHSSVLHSLSDQVPAALYQCGGVLSGRKILLQDVRPVSQSLLC